MTIYTSIALAPKRSFAFLVREYLEPLSNGERLLVAATFLASFVSANGVQARLEAAYGTTIGWLGAIAIEAVYLGAALAGTSARHRSRWQFAGIWAVLAIAAALAITFNLAHEQEKRGGLDAYAAIEAVGFPLLSIICAVLSHGLAGERLQAVEQRREAEEQRRLAAEDAQLALQRQYKEQRMAIELSTLQQEQAARLAAQQAEQAERVKALRRQLRPVRGSVRSEQPANTVEAVPAAPGRGTSSDREQLKVKIANTFREQSKPNKTELARRLGIGRTLLYELIAELKQEGRL